MKKFLLLSVCLVAMPVLAQRTNECALTPLQNLVSNARGAKEIQNLIERGRVFDEPVRCGGSLMQLAIRRGNPEVLRAMLNQDTKRASAMASLEAFPIVGAPKQIPLILFAAYYAPNAQIVDLLVKAGADIAVTDEFGRNLLWYMGKNPVLKNTDLEDKLNNALLYGKAVTLVDPNAPAEQQNQNAEGQQSVSGGLFPTMLGGSNESSGGSRPDSTLIQESP